MTLSILIWLPAACGLLGTALSALLVPGFLRAHDKPSPVFEIEVIKDVMASSASTR